MTTATFLATAPRRVDAARMAQMHALIAAHPAYWVTFGAPSRGQPAFTLCFDGAREYADPAVVARFREITAA